MQEQPTPRPGQIPQRYSDEEAQEVYKRAARIQAETLFSETDDKLSGDQVEEAANRAGISDEAVDAAIAQIEQERAEAQQQAAAKAKTRRQVLTVVGVMAALLVVNGVLTQRGFSTRMAAVENTRANVEAALQRRQDLIPNVLALAKENLGNQRGLIEALKRPDVDSATLKRAQTLLEQKGIESGPLDELAGTENRITVARRRFNESASDYNRNASSFPAAFWRPIFGFPQRVEPFAADKSAQAVPRF